jgi:DNA-binding response OmpR family regulator
MMLPDPRLSGPARALLVIDQQPLAETVRHALNHGRYNTKVAPTIEDAARALAVWNPHIVVLDEEVTGSSNLERLGDPADAADRVAIVALTRRADLKARLEAFERGVDDIMTVPFSPDELLARVLAVMRRTYANAVAFTRVLRRGDLEIDVLNRRVRAGDCVLHLTSLEQSLLYLLAANAGRLITRDEILDHLWGADYLAESNVVDRHIRNLRVKLQSGPQQHRYIVTVPGRGYRFVTPEEPKFPSPLTSRREETS